jgi:hypothetical protein
MQARETIRAGGGSIDIKGGYQKHVRMGGSETHGAAGDGLGRGVLLVRAIAAFATCV